MAQLREGRVDHPELRIGDIWTPHPELTKSHYAWRLIGRADDIIHIPFWRESPPWTDGEFNQVRGVSEVLIMGRGHRQPVLMVELHAKEG